MGLQTGMRDNNHQELSSGLREALEEFRELHSEFPDVHASVTLAEWGLGVYDEKGNKVSEYKEIAKSFNRNAHNALATMLLGVAVTGTGTFGDGHLNQKNTSGTIVGSTIRCFQPPTYSSPLGDLTYGIVVGSGSGATSFDGFEMDTTIAHGKAAGELWYYRTEPERYYWDAGTREWACDIYRFMNNYTGGVISVNEIGLIASAIYIYPTTSEALVVRDLVSPTVTVDHYHQLRCRYRLVTSAFPS
jgi:hypothetical protein